jgi:hypothetical protein
VIVGVVRLGVGEVAQWRNAAKMAAVSKMREDDSSYVTRAFASISTQRLFPI